LNPSWNRVIQFSQPDNHLTYTTQHSAFTTAPSSITSDVTQSDEDINDCSGDPPSLEEIWAACSAPVVDTFTNVSPESSLLQPQVILYEDFDEVTAIDDVIYLSIHQDDIILHTGTFAVHHHQQSSRR
jgi:hypothetical protein